VQVGSVVQVHPVPDIAVIVSPEGGVSVTVTVPTVVPAPPLFITTTEYVAPTCPCKKTPLPFGDFEMENLGTKMVVGAEPFAVGEFPPITCTELVSVGFAVKEMFTVTVITG